MGVEAEAPEGPVGRPPSDRPREASSGARVPVSSPDVLPAAHPTSQKHECENTAALFRLLLSRGRTRSSVREASSALSPL